MEYNDALSQRIPRAPLIHANVAGFSVVIVFSMTMGCAAHRPANPDSTRPTTKPTAAAHPLNRTIIGQSVEGRPIEVVRFGDGPAPVLVIAAVHGDEPIITLELPHHQPGEAAWQANRDALLAVLDQSSAPDSASP